MPSQEETTAEDVATTMGLFMKQASKNKTSIVIAPHVVDRLRLQYLTKVDDPEQLSQFLSLIVATFESQHPDVELICPTGCSFAMQADGRYGKITEVTDITTAKSERFSAKNGKFLSIGRSYHNDFVGSQSETTLSRAHCLLAIMRVRKNTGEAKQDEAGAGGADAGETDEAGGADAGETDEAGGADAGESRQMASSLAVAVENELEEEKAISLEDKDGSWLIIDLASMFGSQCISSHALGTDLQHMKSERGSRRLLRLPKDDSYVLRLGEKQRIWVNPKECVICREYPREMTLSCGHSILCRQCYNKVDICPLCMKPIEREQACQIEKFDTHNTFC